jgi:hypothetical protein
VTIPFPFLSFNTELLQVSISTEENSILATIPSEPAIIEGTLHSSVQSFTLEPARDHILIRLVKGSATEWPHLISDSHPATNGLDPKSAFDLFLTTRARGLFERCLAAGFVPALLLAFEWSLAGDDAARERGTAFLMVAANTYEDPQALLTLGDQLAATERTRPQAYEVYRMAVAAGTIRGLGRIGRLISPLGDIAFGCKDAVRAAVLFEQVIEKMEDPVALNELAKLLLNGVGVNQDVERAHELHSRALVHQPDLPPLGTVGRRRTKDRHSPFLAIYRWAAFIGFACAGMYVFYRIWESRHIAGADTAE